MARWLRLRLLFLLELATAISFLSAVALCSQPVKSGIAGAVDVCCPPGARRRDPHYKGPLNIMRFPDGQRAASATSDANGHFTVNLPPGRYVVALPNPSLKIYIHQAKPGERERRIPYITVEQDKVAMVKIHVYNGIH